MNTGPVILTRDVEAAFVQVGTQVTLRKGEPAHITQSLGFSDTAMVIDNIFMWVVNMGVGIAVGVFYVVINGGPLNPQDEVSLRLISFAVGIGASMLYFIITEGVYQKSVGKFITGTKVVTATGGRPTFGQIVGRTFARFIPFEAFSFLSGSKPVGWHDSLSGTRVIMVR